MTNEIVTIGDFSMPLSRFCDMIAERIAIKIKADNQPAIITQRQAQQKYGRRNVDLWISSGRLKFTTTSTGRRYIRTVDIEMLAEGTQGYIR